MLGLERRRWWVDEIPDNTGKIGIDRSLQDRYITAFGPSDFSQ